MRPEAYLDVALDIWSAAEETTVCTLAGSCMAPLLREGDRLTIRHGNETIRLGDIAVFRSPEGILVNRVLGWEEREGSTRFTLKADRSPVFRRGILREDILGRVIGVEDEQGLRSLETRWGRWLGRYLALRSYVTGRAARPDSLFWRSIRRLIGVRARLLHTSRSLSPPRHRATRGGLPAPRPTAPPEGEEQKEAKQNG